MFKSIKYPKPVLCPEYPWEEKHTYLYGSVIELQDKLRMYYQSYVGWDWLFLCALRSQRMA